MKEYLWSFPGLTSGTRVNQDLKILESAVKSRKFDRLDNSLARETVGGKSGEYHYCALTSFALQPSLQRKPSEVTASLRF